MNSLSDRIKEVRQDNNMSQKEFADVIGVNPSYISQIEKNRKFPSDRLIKTICSNFVVKEKWLKTGEGDKHKTLSDIKPITLEQLERLVKHFEEKHNLVTKNKESASQGAPESTISERSMPEYVQKTDDDPDQMAVAKSMVDMMQKIDEMHGMLKKLTAVEVENKKLKDLIANFNTILNDCQPPEGIEERRSCRLEYAKLFKSA